MYANICSTFFLLQIDRRAAFGAPDKLIVRRSNMPTRMTNWPAGGNSER
jgi:hypothetical protein